MKTAFICAIVIALAGCAPPMRMHEVMQSCENLPQFQEYARCVETMYSERGTKPNSAWWAAFRAQLREFSEDVDAGRLTNAQAKGAAHRAYLEVVKAANSDR